MKMGKLPYMYTDSETEDTSSSVENLKKKKKKLSILKYTNGNTHKKKCKLHTKSEPEDEYRYHRVKRKLTGILKHTERETSEDDDESESYPPPSLDRFLVGRVPRPPGAKPGRGGGLAIIVKKNINNIQAHQSTHYAKRKRTGLKKLTRKRSY